MNGQNPWQMRFIFDTVDDTMSTTEYGLTLCARDGELEGSHGS